MPISSITVRLGKYSERCRHPKNSIWHAVPITAALVGIAGAFIGLHISIILGLLPSPLMHFILAAVGAFAVLWFLLMLPRPRRKPNAAQPRSSAVTTAALVRLTSVPRQMR